MKQIVSKLADVKRQALIILQKREYKELGKSGRELLANGTPMEQARYRSLKAANSADVDFRKLQRDSNAFVDYSTKRLSTGNKAWIAKVAVNIYNEASKVSAPIKPSKANRKEYAKLTGQSKKSKIFFVPLRKGEKVKLKTKIVGKGRKKRKVKYFEFERKEIGGDGREVKTPFYIDPVAFAKGAALQENSKNPNAKNPEVERVLNQVDAYLKKSKAELKAYYIGTGKYIFGGVETPTEIGPRKGGKLPARNLLNMEIMQWNNRYGASVRIEEKQASVNEFFSAIYAVEFYS